MIYYQYHLEWKDYNKEHPNKEGGNAFEEKYNESFINDMNECSRRTYLREDKYILYISNRTNRSIDLCVSVSVNYITSKEYEDEIKEIFSDCVITSNKEITVEEFLYEVSTERTRGGLKIRSILNIDYSDVFFNPLPFEKTEEVYALGTMTKAQCKKRAKKLLASKSLMEELERIYSKDNAKYYYGHPVHYLISAGDWGAAMDISRLLIGALISNKRLLSGRQTSIRNFIKGSYKDERYNMIIDAAEGSTIIIELKDQVDIGSYATDFHEFTKVTGEILKKQKKDTLFIFVEITGESLKGCCDLSNITRQADIIQITEGTGTLQQAKDYLKELVDKTDWSLDDKNEVFDYLPKQTVYSMSDIFAAYYNWYGSGLKSHIYKAYKDQKTCEVVEPVVKSKPYEELQRLIGLNEIKSIVDNIIAAGKVKCIRERMGLNVDGSSMHMVFAGTPGTAKTTIARLLAQILRDEDIITSGNFIECGRQDLVGKYVGWTAKTVEDKFRAAQGGILFIDEAYSLVDGSNTYGAEAINTINQLMENYRNKVIVVFAGYPDKMSDFLDQNEGLRSRITFHLDFPDYSSEELVDILKLMCDKRQYTVTEEALDKCSHIFCQASRIENFGNGRYVRNLLEQAILHQSSRIIKSATETGNKLTKTDVCSLEADDFSSVLLGGRAHTSKIGFAV